MDLLIYVVLLSLLNEVFPVYSVASVGRRIDLVLEASMCLNSLFADFHLYKLVL